VAAAKISSPKTSLKRKLPIMINPLKESKEAEKFASKDTQEWGDVYKAFDEADSRNSETTVDKAHSADDSSADDSCDVIVVDKGQPGRVSLIRKLAPSSCRVMVWTTEASSCEQVEKAKMKNTQCFTQAKLVRGTPQRAFLRYIVEHYTKLASRLYFVSTAAAYTEIGTMLHASSEELASDTDFQCSSPTTKDEALLSSTVQCSAMWSSPKQEGFAKYPVHTANFTLEDGELSEVAASAISNSLSRGEWAVSRKLTHEANADPMAPADCRCWGMHSADKSIRACLKDGKGDGCISAAPEFPMGKWADVYLGEKTSDSFCKTKVCATDLFRTTRHNIVSRPVKQYENIQSSIPWDGDASEVDFYLQKAMRLVYGAPSISDETCSQPKSLTCEHLQFLQNPRQKLEVPLPKDWQELKRQSEALAKVFKAGKANPAYPRTIGQQRK
jgi:hypothetical protein